MVSVRLALPQTLHTNGNVRCLHFRLFVCLFVCLLSYNHMVSVRLLRYLKFSRVHFMATVVGARIGEGHDLNDHHT